MFYKFNKSNLAALKNSEKDAICFKCNDNLFQCLEAAHLKNF